MKRISRIGIICLSLISLLSVSCCKEDVYPYDRVCLSEGESRVVELDSKVDIFEDSVRLLYEDTGVCSLSAIGSHNVTVTALRRGVDILHVEYSTNKNRSSYGCIEIPVEVN